jgi:hypothetical protein
MLDDIQQGHSIYKLSSANKDGANYLVALFDRYVLAINAFIKRGFEVSTIISYAMGVEFLCKIYDDAGICFQSIVE